MPQKLYCGVNNLSFGLLFRNEKVRGFYKGLIPNLLRVVPATALTFMVYEHTSHFLAGYRKKAVDKGTTPQ